MSLTLANQYLAQLDPQVREAILGNVGTLIAFRLGPDDAELLAREFAPEISEIDFLRLPNYRVYPKLMVDGAPTSAFSAETVRLQNS